MKGNVLLFLKLKLLLSFHICLQNDKWGNCQAVLVRLRISFSHSLRVYEPYYGNTCQEVIDNRTSHTSQAIVDPMLNPNLDSFTFSQLG